MAWTLNYPLNWTLSWSWTYTWDLPLQGWALFVDAWNTKVLYVWKNNNAIIENNVKLTQKLQWVSFWIKNCWTVDWMVMNAYSWTSEIFSYLFEWWTLIFSCWWKRFPCFNDNRWHLVWFTVWSSVWRWWKDSYSISDWFLWDWWEPNDTPWSDTATRRLNMNSDWSNWWSEFLISQLYVWEWFRLDWTSDAKSFVVRYNNENSNYTAVEINSWDQSSEYIWEYHECNVNTMGPCDDWYHIPTRAEWQEVNEIWKSLWLWTDSTNGTWFKLQFNMPVCWKLNNDWTYTSSPTDAVYWFADKQSSWYGRDMWLRDSVENAVITDDTVTIRWWSLRAFKNQPVIPNIYDPNWWLDLWDRPDLWWIYDNEEEWIISISADWSKWVTIQDKNVWATEKWFIWDTMTEANCWKFFQWGNNHWFPFTWATKTSATAVDASDYGPLTEDWYYSSDTFITANPWDSSDNRNLWGWVSWPTRNCDLGWWSLWPSTVVCDFRAWAAWETTTLNEMLVLWDFCRERSWKTWVTYWSNWTLRLQIPSTDYSWYLCLWWTEWNWAITNRWYANGVSVGWALRQNLIKKAYARISWTNDASYPQFCNWWIAVNFTKKLVSSNWDWGNNSTSWFIFHRSNYWSRDSYRRFPIDSNVQYLVLPSTPNVGNWLTCSQYIDQWVSCFTSRVTLETRWTKPEEMHYWLIIDASGNEYDLWLCSDLWAASLCVESWDWWHSWCYKEVDEAFIEYYDGYYIDESWNITDTKPW